MYAANYPLEWIGPDEKSGLIYSDYCKIIRDLPELHTLENGTVFIGKWCEIAVYPEDDRYYVRRSYLRERKE